MKPELLVNFPPKNEEELFDYIQFVKKSPLAKDYWPVIKSLYKKSEQALLNQEFPQLTNNLLLLITQLIIKLDEAELSNLTSPYPTQATLRYMKRRARRFLKKVAENSPENYFLIASKVILAQENKQNIQFDHQWVIADIILGNSLRCRQRSNGQGKYIFEDQRFNLNHREEKHAHIWEENSAFLQSLLQKNLPWEIYEFAVKVYYHNQWQVKDISDEVLFRFFNSPSAWLKRTAVQLAYATYTYQGLQPEIFAGLWLFSAADLRKNIENIQSRRPKQDKSWNQDFANSLFDLIFKALYQGNNSRRIILGLEFLHKKYPKAIITDNLLPIAPVLFSSGVKVMEELAFMGAEKAKKANALDWLLALDPGGVEKRPKMPMIDRLALILLPKFKKVKFSRRELEPYIFQKSFAACDFGWRLSKQIRYSYDLYYIWNRISNFRRRRSMKEEYWRNTITSMAGVDAFLSYYDRNDYYLFNFPDDAFSMLMDEGLERIKRFVLKRYKQRFAEQPLQYLNQIALLPEQTREEMLEHALKKQKNKPLFERYWYLWQAFNSANTNDWVANALLKFIFNSKIDLRSVRNILDQLWDREKLFEKYIPIFNDAEESFRKHVLVILTENAERVIGMAQKVPTNLIEDILATANLNTLLQITQNASTENWSTLSQVIYKQLMQKQDQGGFWKTILERVISSNDNVLNSRLIEDAQFFALFQDQKDVSILEITDPDMEDLLLAWAEKNPELFPMESSELFKLCLHKLTKLRHWGLNLAKLKGITLIFGLQLLESDLPDAMNAAKEYFDSLTPHSQKELEAALALCDSPNRATREFGLGYLGKRKENFKDNAQILEFLSEHSDVAVQTFIAQEINQLEIEKPFVKRFDREILRMKNRSRKAKETVKARVSTTLEIDAKTLLEMARSTVKQDAEWAVEQLTKKVLAGEEIQGFDLD